MPTVPVISQGRANCCHNAGGPTVRAMPGPQTGSTVTVMVATVDGMPEIVEIRYVAVASPENPETGVNWTALP